MENKKSLCLSVVDLTHELGISRPYAYELVQRSDFPSFRLGRRIIVSREGLEKWLADQTASASRAEA